MGKELINKFVNSVYVDVFDKYLPIDELLMRINAFKKSGATHLWVSGDIDQGDLMGIQFSGYKRREETEEEYLIRMDVERRHRLAEEKAQRELDELKTKNERAEYERLKQKYGKRED